MVILELLQCSYVSRTKKPGSSAFWRFAAFLLIAHICEPPAFPQVCPRAGIDKTLFIGQVQRADSPDVILRSSAIAGEAVVPALLALSKPVANVDSIPGAAQVSLAKLGKKTALQQLQQELSDPNSFRIALDKLVRIGNDAALSILMKYLREHLSDPSPCRFSDYGGWDPRVRITEAISTRLDVGPTPPKGSLQDWVNWWESNGGKPIALSISGALHDPYLRCLARKVEWGFPDAIFDMTNSGNPEVVPVLKTLASFGNQRGRSFNLATLQGRAQYALARLGDQQELKEIYRGLDDQGYSGAIEELRLIGGKDAVAALINAFDSPNFLPQYKGFRNTYHRQVRRRDEQLANVLIQMVISPPETKPSPESKKKWKEWWAKNKDTAVFVTPPSKSYE